LKKIHFEHFLKILHKYKSLFKIFQVLFSSNFKILSIFILHIFDTVWLIKNLFTLASILISLELVLYGCFLNKQVEVLYDWNKWAQTQAIHYISKD